MIDELLAQFLIEGREQALEASADLAALQRAPHDAARLDSCFRAIHTLKGSADLLGLKPLGRVLHVAEDRLGALRGGTEATPDFTRLVTVVDQVERWLDALEATGVLPADADAVADRFLAVLGSVDGGAPGPVAGRDSAAPFAGKAGTAIRYTPRADCYFAGDDPIAIIAGVPDLVELRVDLREPIDDQALYDPFTCNLVIQALSTADWSLVEASLRLVRDQVELTQQARAPVEPAPVEPATPIEADAGRRTLRIDAARIDQLADITDQLVVAKSGFGDLAAQADRLEGGQGLGSALRARQVELDRLVASLHATVGRARLTPLTPLFGRFPRLVREIAAGLGKTVSLDVEGGDVEVDKAVVDGLFEPLLHVVRNAVDHGVEAEAIRLAAGKPAQAVVKLAARAVGDQVVVEMTDDGGGVDPARIRARALSRGLIDETAASALSDADLIDLIFQPGFSTADTVSSVSGRGVGMDAVRSATAKLGGRVEVSSQLGRGSTIRLILPIRMVLARLLVVATGHELFGLMLEDIVEVTRVSANQVVAVRAGHAFVLRDAVVPLVWLEQTVGGVAGSVSAVDRVVVAKFDGERVGFAVDAVKDRIDAVVRPMSGLLSGAAGVVGSTLTADGDVLLVLNLAELLA
ncbi:chemotaxis protein CheA [Caulobacter segnis]